MQDKFLKFQKKEMFNTLYKNTLIEVVKTMVCPTTSIVDFTCYNCIVATS